MANAFSVSALGIFILLADLLCSTQAQICAPFTPNLPLSGPLAGSAAITNAIENITAVIEGSITLAIAADTSFSIDFYSLRDEGSLFSYHFSAGSLQNATEGVSEVDSNTIYRIGSISKVFTVYTFLANEGDVSWNEPITRYIPELAEAATSSEGDSDLDVVRWEDVTIGSLASHLAGVSRDIQTRSAIDEATLIALGFPPPPELNGSYCGGPEYEFPCDRSTFFDNILGRHPVVAPFHAPTYSNLAFQLLAYALENITSTEFGDLVNSTLADLPLNSTYLNLPPSPDTAVIPINASASWYSTDIGPLSPGGSYYSTINDLREFGLSILNYTILSPSLTRRWLKPHSFTPDSYTTVGAPWEIVPYPADGRFQTRIYAKSGALGLYSSQMRLIPDYNVGFTVLAAGSVAGVANTILSDLVSSTFLQAVQAAAREQTEQLYADTYEDEATNSSFSVSVAEADDGRAYLQIDNWVFKGADLAGGLATILGVNTTLIDLRFNLFPAGLTGPGPNGTELQSWRGAYSILLPNDTSTADSASSAATALLLGPFSSACGNWAAVDGLTYGGVSFDEFTFAIDPQTGEAASVDIRVLRSGLLDKITSGSSSSNATATGGDSAFTKRNAGLNARFVKKAPQAVPYVVHL